MIPFRVSLRWCERVGQTRSHTVHHHITQTYINAFECGLVQLVWHSGLWAAIVARVCTVHTARRQASPIRSTPTCWLCLAIICSNVAERKYGNQLKRPVICGAIEIDTEMTRTWLCSVWRIFGAASRVTERSPRVERASPSLPKNSATAPWR